MSQTPKLEQCIPVRCVHLDIDYMLIATPTGIPYVTSVSGTIIPNSPTHYRIVSIAIDTVTLMKLRVSPVQFFTIENVTVNLEHTGMFLRCASRIHFVMLDLAYTQPEPLK
nr:hypothetical protein [Salmonid herpesvirus 1]